MRLLTAIYAAERVLKYVDRIQREQERQRKMQRAGVLREAVGATLERTEALMRGGRQSWVQAMRAAAGDVAAGYGAESVTAHDIVTAIERDFAKI